MARDISIGYMILHNSSDQKFAALKYDLNQAFLTGTNIFPDSAEEALGFLSNLFSKKPGKHSNNRTHPKDDDVSADSTEPAVNLHQTDTML